MRQNPSGHAFDLTFDSNATIVPSPLQAQENLRRRFLPHPPHPAVSIEERNGFAQDAEPAPFVLVTHTLPRTPYIRSIEANCRVVNNQIEISEIAVLQSQSEIALTVRSAIGLQSIVCSSWTNNKYWILWYLFIAHSMTSGHISSSIPES